MFDVNYKAPVLLGAGRGPTNGLRGLLASCRRTSKRNGGSANFSSRRKLVSLSSCFIPTMFFLSVNKEHLKQKIPKSLYKILRANSSKTVSSSHPKQRALL